MSDRDDPQIDNIKNPKLKELARQSRGSTTLDFGMTRPTGVDLEKFAELVRQEALNEMAAAAPKPPKP